MPDTGHAAADRGFAGIARRGRDAAALRRLHSPIVAATGGIDADPQTDSGAPRLDLAGDEIHLWCTNFEQIRGPDLEAAYFRLLSPAERARQARFHFDRDRHRFLVTRALVRTVLSRYASVTPCHWLFATNAHGRPRIANPEAGPGSSGLTFNVSHTEDLIVLGIARGTRLGVDAELVNGGNADLDIAANFFSPMEVSELQALPASLQPQHFLELWTLKESYIKARGEGMSIPLDQFGFTLPGATGIEMCLDPRQADHASAWRFLQYRLASGHLVAVCSDIGRRTRTTLRSVVPLRSEQVLRCSPTRASDPADLHHAGATN